MTYPLSGIPDYILYGDLAGDGLVGYADLLLLIRYLAQPDVYGMDINLAAADVNCDGVVDYVDLVLMLRYFARQGIVLGLNLP